MRQAALAFSLCVRRWVVDWAQSSGRSDTTSTTQALTPRISDIICSSLMTRSTASAMNFSPAVNPFWHLRTGARAKLFDATIYPLLIEVVGNDPSFWQSYFRHMREYCENRARELLVRRQGGSCGIGVQNASTVPNLLAQAEVGIVCDHLELFSSPDCFHQLRHKKITQPMSNFHVPLARY